jgi:hypothetical protein
MPEYDNFMNDLLEFLDTRSTNGEFISNNEEFQEVKTKLESYYTKIREHLPKKDKSEKELKFDIIYEMDNIIANLLTMAVDAGYRQGFSEGIKFIIMSLTIDN